MRELEFLPDWYPQTRRSRRLLKVQGWASLTLILGLGLWMQLVGHNTRQAEASYAAIRGELSHTEAQLQKLDELLNLQKQWRQQARIIDKLGSHVESTRLCNLIESLMPPEMSLINVSFDMDERPRVVSTLASAMAVQQADQPMDRRLKVKLIGVAPTAIDVANFLARLSGVPYCEQVALSSDRERSESGHLVREFEVAFSLDLSASPGK